MDCLNRYGNPKKRYNTQEEAQKVAETMEETHHEPFNVYCCVECNFWHVGRCNGHEKVNVEEVGMEGK